MEDWLDEPKKSNVSNKTILKYFGIAVLVLLAGAFTIVYLDDKEFGSEFGEWVPTFERVPLDDTTTNATTSGMQFAEIQHRINQLIYMENFVGLAHNGTTMIMTEPINNSTFSIIDYTLTKPYEFESKQKSKSLILHSKDFNSTSYLRVNLPIEGNTFNVDDKHYDCTTAWDIETCVKRQN